ncbi:MAG TPA: hypothetical protein VFR86_16220 [Burkholderiaceae bacterium]|nr:hypothetical protein [Burkholderiaceae bacterium]
MQAETFPASNAIQFDRRRLLRVLAVLAVSVSLHIVPQWLKAHIDPAWTMIALMIADALIFALLAHSGGSLRVAVVLAVLFAITYWSRQNHFVALPSILINLLLAAAFGFSLRRGHMPMIARVAANVMGSAAIKGRYAAYLRGVTIAWTVFFLVMAAISAALAALAPFAWWSLFANVLSWPIVGLMFIAEYAVRRVGFRDLPAHTPLQTLAATLALPRRTFTAP